MTRRSRNTNPPHRPSSTPATRKGIPLTRVARRVRQRLGNSSVRLIALTGYGQPQDRDAAFQAGFDEHLVKPVNPGHLTEVLNRPRKPR
jgi:CheY-like chemotaxis protein